MNASHASHARSSEEVDMRCFGSGAAPRAWQQTCAAGVGRDGLLGGGLCVVAGANTLIAASKLRRLPRGGITGKHIFLTEEFAFQLLAWGSVPTVQQGR